MTNAWQDGFLRDADGALVINSAPVVVLTQAAYDALASPDPNTVYVIS